MKPKPKTQPHETVLRRGIPWRVCRFCGLVYLRNELTARAIREGCERD